MATSTLIKKALKKATPAQLIKVRALLEKNHGAYGFDSWAWRFKTALEAFDKGEYDNEQIAFLLRDGELAKIL